MPDPAETTPASSSDEYSRPGRRISRSALGRNDLGPIRDEGGSRSCSPPGRAPLDVRSPPARADLAEAYLRNDFESRETLGGCSPSPTTCSSSAVERFRAVRLARRLLALPRVERSPSAAGPRPPTRPRLSLGRARQAMSDHYNLEPAFYPLFLDRRMAYSCAYFASEHEDLDTAQERKLDLVCRKLRLVPGERLLDIGCGWGRWSCTRRTLRRRGARRHAQRATGGGRPRARPRGGPRRAMPGRGLRLPRARRA